MAPLCMITEAVGSAVRGWGIFLPSTILSAIILASTSAICASILARSTSLSRFPERAMLSLASLALCRAKSSNTALSCTDLRGVGLDLPWNPSQRWAVAVANGYV